MQSLTFLPDSRNTFWTSSTCLADRTPESWLSSISSDSSSTEWTIVSLLIEDSPQLAQHRLGHGQGDLPLPREDHVRPGLAEGGPLAQVRAAHEHPHRPGRRSSAWPGRG